MEANVRLAIVGLLLAMAGPAMAIEQPRYVVVRQEGDFEIRRYAPYLVAETRVDARFDAAGNEGFRRLFRYITGANSSRTEISMTAPVSQRPAGTCIAMTAPVTQVAGDGGYLISFVVPSDFTRATVPRPMDRLVHIREVPAQLMAVARYSGTWRAARYDREERQLVEALQTRGLSPAGPAQFARYDPPYMPPFMRRNEVLIPLEGFDAVSKTTSRAPGAIPFAP